MKLSLIPVLGLALAFICQPLLAQRGGAALPPASARVAAVSDPSATVLRGNGTSENLRPGLFIYEQDKISTERATVSLVFSNGSQVTLTPDSELEVMTLRQAPFDAKLGSYGSLDRDPSASATRLKLDRGDLVGNVKKLSSNSSFEVQTRLGVAGVRGTVFRVSIRPVQVNGETQWVLSVATAQGNVVLTNVVLPDNSVSTEEVAVGDGEEAVVAGVARGDDGSLVSTVVDDSVPNIPTVRKVTVSAEGVQAMIVAMRQAEEIIEEQESTSQQQDDQPPAPAPAPPAQPPVLDIELDLNDYVEDASAFVPQG
jgi:hypothetical protein